MLVGSRVEKLINERCITKSEILDATGLSKATLYNIINGSGSPSCDNLEKLADFFGVSMDYFFDRQLTHKGNGSIGHNMVFNGNGNKVNGDITIGLCQKEIEHLLSLLEEKERIISEKERTIQILIKSTP